MSGIEIHSLEGGNKIKVPEDKTSVGRGPLLQVTDKKVSRNHATIEINDKGEMVLIPIHTNPCFYKAGGKGDKTILPKDKPKILNHLDVFGLLPDKLYFKVVYLDQLKADRKPKKEVKEEEESETDATDEAENEEGTPTKKKSPKFKDMALPLEKTRKLPKWMVGASKRVSVGQKKATPAKAAKPRVAANAKVTPKRAPPPKRSRRRVSDDDDDEDYEEEVTKPGRRPRAASQKTPKYKDEFVVSGDDLGMSDSSEDDVPKAKNDEDSDFSIDEIDNDSGSDWGAQQKKSKATPTRKGRRGRRRSSRGSASKRRMGSDSEDFLDDDDDDEDNYVPRLSKRRAPPRKKKPETDSEDSEESEEEVKPKKTSKRRRRKDSDSEEERRPKRKTKKKISEDEDDDDDEEDEDAPKKKRRRLCQFGKKCYRKNPAHFKDYCHPGDTSYDEALEEAEEEALRPTRKTALRQKDKRSVLRHASDDDGEANTYDYKDSFLDDKNLSEGDSSSSAFDPNEGDSDYDPEAEEDLAALKHEARGFLRNKKLQKPARRK